MLLLIVLMKKNLCNLFSATVYRNFVSNFKSIKINKTQKKIKGLSELNHSCSSVAIKRFKRLLCITSSNHRLESAGMNVPEELLFRCWQ